MVMDLIIILMADIIKEHSLMEYHMVMEDQSCLPPIFIKVIHNHKLGDIKFGRANGKGYFLTKTGEYQG